MNTPGVYIKELATLANSVAGVSTAVPLFIGFTATNGGTQARISSLLEFTELFGGAHAPRFEVNFTPEGTVEAALPAERYFLYESLSLYFQNNGGPCYILSVGKYWTEEDDTRDLAALIDAAIDRLVEDAFDEATLVCVPDLHMQYTDISDAANPVLKPLLKEVEYGTLTSKLLDKCAELKNKFAVLDALEIGDKVTDDSDKLRNRINPGLAENLRYGAVYYPWVKAVNSPSVSFGQLSLSKDLSADPLIAERNQYSTDLNALTYNFQVGALDKSKLWATYSEKRQEFDAPDSPDKERFSNIFSFLYGLVNGLHLSEDMPAVADFHPAIVALKNNRSFTHQVQRLLSFKGVTDRHPDKLSDPLTLDLPDNAHEWFAPDSTATPAPTVADIEADDSFSGYSPGGLGDGTRKSKRAQVLSDLESGKYVDLDVFFSGIASIIQSHTQRAQRLEERILAENAYYRQALIAIDEYMAQLPSVGAVAGRYTENDRTRGVWSAPANMSLTGIEGPVVNVTRSQQDHLNVDAGSGKSINVIRNFTGRGTLIWGARTLSGNSNEWRYVSVRRYFNFVEKSIEKAIAPFLFSPNNAQTWVRVRAMISSFLVQQWQQGALVGERFEDAFFVSVGLGETMSEQDILEGRMEVQIGLAVSRPAEFIIVQFSHYLSS